MPRSGCPIAVTLDIIGDRWTLLILRDLFMGKTRYGEFLESPEGITTNILAERLKRLTENGIVDKRPYQDRPARYEYVLTKKGRALHPVLKQVVIWAEKYVPDVWEAPDSFMKLS